jgi:regulator of nonsense transcripts 1
LTLHYKVRNIKNPDFAKLKEFFARDDDSAGFTLDEELKFKKLRKAAEKDILSKAEVICATCIASADKRLNELTFNHVLIDEATQAIEP